MKGFIKVCGIEIKTIKEKKNHKELVAFSKKDSDKLYNSLNKKFKLIGIYQKGYNIGLSNKNIKYLFRPNLND
jgi:hypothetical protein